MRLALLATVPAVALLLTACTHQPAGPAATEMSHVPLSSISVTPSSIEGVSMRPASARNEASPIATQLPLIDHVRWTVTAHGRQLQVFPTAAGRTQQAPADSARAWAQVLAQAPAANAPGMHDQFLCHWNFARIAEPDKPSWNLEPWRPTVGYPATVAALCNPGAPED